ncbi:MAG: [protein-PII] uridylyltransferase [Gammaproteobacteria bacterium]
MKPDLELFNEVQFRRSLKKTSNTLALFKAALQEGNETLKHRFELDVPVVNLVKQRADLIDAVLTIAWEHYKLDQTSFSLVAVGGYGRAELHPGSDIDLAIIFEQEPDAATNECLSAFVTFLWDIGLEVGLSVRTVAECAEEGSKDITIATNLMEARLLAGSLNIFEAMKKATGPDQIWSNKDFFENKFEEQIKRHKKFANTSHNLEPNVKEGLGGLRDIQMIGWVVKRYFGADTLEELVHHDFLTENEYKTLNAGQNFLWRVRYALHLLAGRREDRLMFEFQKKVAAQFGFLEDSQNHAIEGFMKLYYRTITELSQLNEMLLGFFKEVLLENPKDYSLTPVNKRFQIRDGYIKTVRPNIFKRSPFALLEIFLLIQQNPQIQGVRSNTIRAIRDHLYLIDDKFRNDIRARSLFMEIMRQPRRLGHELQRMQRYGVLGAYLPAFEAITGQMQFDLFHVYTVDEHTLKVVRNLRRYDQKKSIEKLPLCAQAYREIPKPELLFLAGLFHDIAKGRGGDHAELGAIDASEFCAHHGLGTYDTNLVAWLVKYHLKMSVVAQKTDLSDPEVINKFAKIIGDKTHLDYLYLLTVADIRGTNPDLWNGWKDSLLKELYRKTLKALRRGIENPIEEEERIANTKAQVLSMMADDQEKINKLEQVWKNLGDDYFLRHSTDEIAWETESIIDLDDSDLPLIKIRQKTRRGGTEIFIFCHDRDSLFAAMTHSMDQMGLTVVDARVFTTKDGRYNLDTYIVLEAATNKPINSVERADEIIKKLKEYLSSSQPEFSQIERLQPRQLRSFNYPATISFSEDKKNQRTVMEVTAVDQPGILALMGMAMAFCGVRLHNAKVATYGERVEDIFYLTDLKNQPIKDPLKLECLENTLMSALNPENISVK